MRSVALGFWIRTGSRDETPPRRRGSRTSSSTCCSRAPTASARARSTRSSTRIGRRGQRRHRQGDDLGLLALPRQHSRRGVRRDVRHGAAPDATRDIDSEREVVIEEIAMYEDEPAGQGPRRARRRPSSATTRSAGRSSAAPSRSSSVAGARDRGLPRRALRRRQPRGRGRRQRRPRRGSSSSARTQLDAGAGAGVDGPAAAARRGVDPRRRFHAKETEQYHLCARRPRASPAATTAASRCGVLDTILGGSTSSRLFQEVREKRGLAYAVYSYASQFADTGQVGIYVGTRPDNVAEAMEIIGRELRASARRRHHRRGARARAKRERQGPHRRCRWSRRSPG